jgi:hypothetical protein
MPAYSICLLNLWRMLAMCDICLKFGIDHIFFKFADKTVFMNYNYIYAWIPAYGIKGL